MFFNKNKFLIIIIISMKIIICKITMKYGQVQEIQNVKRYLITLIPMSKI